MGFRQFANSLRSILSNSHINRVEGVAKHLHWQYLKAFDLFPIELEISHSRIIAAHKRCGVSALIYSQRLYNYNNMKLLQILLKDGGSFLDIGANIGSFTLIASEQERARVFAFEPHPATFQQLQHNVELNRRSNVKLFNVALGQSEGQLFLTDEPGSASNYVASHGGERMVAVPSTRVDTICAQHGIHPQYAKIDVEGFEYDVLAGFGTALDSVNMLMIEMNGLSDQRSHGQREIHALLRECGFSGPWQCDFDRKLIYSRGSSDLEDSIYLSNHGAHLIVQSGLSISDSA